MQGVRLRGRVGPTARLPLPPRRGSRAEPSAEPRGRRPRPRAMTSPRTAATVLLCVLLAGCGQVRSSDALRAAPPPEAAPASTDCPSGSDGPAAIVDYVPFVRHGGLQYVHWGSAAGEVRQEQVGRQVGTVTCRLSDTAYDPDRRPQDGDAAFLPAGTALHALQGADPTVRLVARGEDGWQLYELDDDPAARRGGELLDLRDVVAVHLVEAERGEHVVRSVTDPAEGARVVDAVAAAPLHDRDAQQAGVEGPQWFVRFQLADGPPVQRAWYPEGRWLFPRVSSPEALHDALLR